MTLLFRLAEWHALAKLRLHTDATLDTMDDATVKLGHQMRKFENTTCNAFQTYELDREVQARTHTKGSKQVGNTETMVTDMIGSS